MKTYFFSLVVALLITASSLSAQKPTLQVNGNKESTEVYLQSLDIQVEVTGNVATTKYTMTFKNRTGKMLEGELLFPLPDGVTVSHYALDINGRMRDAVPVEKAKATQVFEEIEQRRVDPGLLERVEGNNFRTRIYPFPSNGTRTITIGYEEELNIENKAYAYHLPLDYNTPIENFSVKATVWQGKAKPQTNKSLSRELKFDEAGNNFTAGFSRKDYQPSPISFSLPISTSIPQVVTQPASGSYYFLANCYPGSQTRKKVWSDEIGIIWDASLSGARRDKEREMQLLDMIIKEKKNLAISLYLLNNRFTPSGTFHIKNGDWSALRNSLEAVIYDGGTDFSAIKLNNTDSKEFLFFSDGLSTLSDNNFIDRSQSNTFMLVPELKRSNADKPVHCITSSVRSDYSALKWIAGQTSGKFINLNTLSDTRLKEEITFETLHFLGMEKPGSIREVYPSIATPVNGNFSIAGIMDTPHATITLLFGYGNKVEKRIPVTIQANNNTQQANVHKIWAQKKISELDMSYDKNKEELTELGQQFGIVTRNTSLIVLETLQDYITYDITPPAELLPEYTRWKKGQDEQRQQMKQNLLQTAIAAAENLKQWWKTDYTIKKSKYPVPDQKNDGSIPPPVLETVSDEILNIVEDDMMIAADIAFEEESELMEVVSSGFVANAAFADRRAEQSSSVSKVKDISASKQKEEQKAVIRLKPIKQDNEYTKLLTGNAEADYETYLKLRAEYINTPTYYFDMADWFYKLDDREKALRILTSIADIDIENTSLYRLLGYRLKEYKEYAMEAFICKKVIEWRPMEPQSYRDYALALADNGKYQEALNSLYSVFTQSYARNISQRSSGIEEVTVTEINQLISKNKRLNTSDIDNKLIQAMPVDIRVVINWNMNSTDIDLHVKDPNGETCFYGHKATAIGGRISRDITQGYGPEQFMLKKAIKGKYKVYVNYFGDSQVKAEGPSTVMLEIYTNYSTGEEKREVVCLQMSKNKQSGSGLIEVAEFEF